MSTPLDEKETLDTETEIETKTETAIQDQPASPDMDTKKRKQILAVKITLLSLVGGVTLYCLYAVIGQLIIWSQQPRFVSVATGAKTVSAGFLIQTAAFGFGFLVMAAATVFMAIKFFKKKKKKQ